MITLGIFDNRREKEFTVQHRVRILFPYALSWDFNF